MPRLRLPPMCVFFPMLTYSIFNLGFCSANLTTDWSTRLSKEPSSTTHQTSLSSGQFCAKMFLNANLSQCGRFHVSVTTPTRGKTSSRAAGGCGGAPQAGEAGIFSKSRSIVFQRSVECWRKIAVRSLTVAIKRLRVAKISSCDISSSRRIAVSSVCVFRRRGFTKNSHGSVDTDPNICPFEPIRSSKKVQYAGTSDQSGKQPVSIASVNA